jgi:hypothetical protein
MVVPSGWRTAVDRRPWDPEVENCDDISSYLTVLVPCVLTRSRSDDTLVLLQLQITLNLTLHLFWAPYDMFRFAFDQADYALKEGHLAVREWSPARIRDCDLSCLAYKTLTRFPAWRASAHSGPCSSALARKLPIGASIHSRSGRRGRPHFDSRKIRHSSSICVPRHALRSSRDASIPCSDRATCFQRVSAVREIHKIIELPGR